MFSKKIIFIFIELSFLIWFLYQHWKFIPIGILVMLPVIMGYNNIPFYRRKVWAEFLKKHITVFHSAMTFIAIILIFFYKIDVYKIDIFSQNYLIEGINFFFFALFSILATTILLIYILLIKYEIKKLIGK